MRNFKVRRRNVSATAGLQHYVVILAIFLLGIQVNTCCTSSQTVTTKTANPAVASSAELAFDVARKLDSAEPDANVLFSPVSISATLAMAYAGSHGDTESQMAKVLHFGPAQQEVAAGMHEMIAFLKPKEGAPYQLRIANALWAQQAVSLHTEFLTLMNRYYGGDFKTVDFNKAEQSSAIINRWVAEKTANRIQHVLGPTDIKDEAGLILTNAVYFKGNWSSPFTAEFTAPAPFRTSRGAKKQLPMMHLVSRFRYSDLGDMQLLELPYEGDQFTMLILLPKAKAKQPFAELTWAKLQQMQHQMAPQSVEVFLPKFKVTKHCSLAPTLSHLGIRNAFDVNRADFSGISGRNRWWISDVIHTAVIEVNESGTEASAFTGVVETINGAKRSVPPPTPIFRADHPFVYLIVHKPSSAILFLGRLSNRDS